jgi:hypothetical protein
MQGQGNERPPIELPVPASPEYEAQKLVLLELVVDAPPEGDDVERICGLLDATTDEVDAALDALVGAGLVERHPERARASLAARYFEHLWPMGL